MSTLIKRGAPDIYKLPMLPIHCSNRDGVCKYAIGNPLSGGISKSERVLVLIGAANSGKETLINGLANYLFGVKFNSGFRFKLVASEDSGSRNSIIVYTFYSTVLDYTLTVISTPRFGDTGEPTKRDRHIARQILTLFEGQSKCGINVVHGIAFVTQASMRILTPALTFVFGAALSSFGKDISDNLLLFTTFAADASNPPTQDTLRAANMPFQHCFKFNNSALFSSMDSEESAAHSMFWEMGMKCFANFFVHFTKATATNLVLTRQVLRERKHVGSALNTLQLKVEIGLNQINEIEREEKMLESHQQCMKESEHFECNVEVTKIRKVALRRGVNQNTMTCRNCNFTCHEGCIYFDDDDEKAQCSVMIGGYCTVCPNRCHWTCHSNVPYRIEYYTETVVKTYDAMKEVYLKAKSENQQVEKVLAEKQKQLESMQHEMPSLISKVQAGRKRLNEIALKTGPITEMEIVVHLITSEQTSDWRVTVKKCKERAKILKRVVEFEITDRMDETVMKALWNSIKSTVI